MQLGIVTLFPQIGLEFSKLGVTGRAIDSGHIGLFLENPRDYADDRHRTVDDRPYGGGPGMVMKVQPLSAAIRALREKMPGKSRTLLMSPQGRRFDQALARELAALDSVILVCGRYEGVDDRLSELEIDDEISVGDFVASGGELPALLVADAIVRLVPGVLGDENSAQQDSFVEGLLDCPHYTRPEEIAGLKVPAVLLSGDHEQVRRWRLKQALGRTWERRPELLRDRRLNEEQQGLLNEFIAEAQTAANDDET